MGLGGIGGIGNIAVRVLLIISAAVIIGLSVNLRNTFEYYTRLCTLYRDANPDLNLGDCGIGGWTTGSRYGIFVGVFGLVTAFLGLVPTFLASGIVWILAVVADALAAIFYLAGAIDFTVMFNRAGGNSDFCRNFETDDGTDCKTFKTRIQADLAFMWIGFVLSIVVLGLLMLVRRSNK